MTRSIPLLAALCFAVGCDPCPDYCEAECACPQFADDASCVETCLSTMDVFDGSARQDECSSRLTELETDPDACR